MSWGRDWVTAPPHQPLVTQSLHPDSPPAEQLQQLLAEAGLAEVCMSACVYGGGEEGLWGQEVLPRHVKGDSQPGYNLGGRRRWGQGESGW